MRFFPILVSREGRKQIIAEICLDIGERCPKMFLTATIGLDTVGIAEHCPSVPYNIINDSVLLSFIQYSELMTIAGVRFNCMSRLS